MAITYGPVVKLYDEYPIHEASEAPPPGPESKSQPPRVYWAALMERTVQDHAVNTLLDVAMQAGRQGYIRIRWGL